jgi:ribonuclease VapC
MGDKYIFDSYARIAYFRQEPGFDCIAGLLESVAEQDNVVITCAINLGEVYYMLCRKQNVELAQFALDTIAQLPVNIIIPDLKLILLAAKIKARHKISYADAFAIQVCIENDGILISDVPEIHHLKDYLGLKCLKVAELPY